MRPADVGSFGVVGVLEITGSATGSPTSLRGRTVHLGRSELSNGSPFYGRPPDGATFATKLRIEGTTDDITCWAGLAGAANTWPDAAGSNTCDLIGVRCTDPNGVGLGNWYGVVRNGTTETTVDLSIAADTTWRIMGWRATSTGIQFRTYSGGSWSDVGSEVAFTSSSMPSTSAQLSPLVGAGTHGAQRKARCDFWELLASGVSR